MNNEILANQIRAIKDRADLLEVIQQFESLKKKGRNYVCKCPFHNENTGSFTVSSAKGIFKCFGCEAAGKNAIDFLILHEKVDFIGAIKWLADFYRMPYEENNTNIYAATPRSISPPKLIKRPVYIPKDLFNTSIAGCNHSNFVKFLYTQFEPCIVHLLCDKYYIGSSRRYKDWVIFWQVDTEGNIRYGKIMGYDSQTGKRIKAPYDQFTTVSAATLRKHEKEGSTAPEWAIKYDQQDVKPSCLFGLHLIDEDNTKPIAVVESEKTAIVASVFFPQFIWLATGMKSYTKYNLKGEINLASELLRDKFKALAGREVILVPDLGAVDDWRELANQLSDIASFTVNDILQSAADKYHLPAKSDLCDYLTSEAARNELIDDFKTALIERNPQTTSEHTEVWFEYEAMGLRRIDRRTAYHQLIAEGHYREVQEWEANPHHYTEEEIILAQKRAHLMPGIQKKAHRLFCIVRNNLRYITGSAKSGSKIKFKQAA